MEYSQIFVIIFQIFFLDLEEIIFENFNISENSIISVELAKVLGYRPFMLLVWPVSLAQVLSLPQLIFPSKTWFFGIYLNFQW
jgi:hypothetical protein